VDWNLSYLFGSSPKTILEDVSQQGSNFAEADYQQDLLTTYL
jgi:phosphoribosylformylglycinamidine synthase